MIPIPVLWNTVLIKYYFSDNFPEDPTTVVFREVKIISIHVLLFSCDVLKMPEANSAETMVQIQQYTCCQVPEHSNFYQQRFSMPNSSNMYFMALVSLRYLLLNCSLLFTVLDNTGQQNLTYFLSHEEKYLILIVFLTLNSNM
jgi:hypothetical protein